MDKYLRHQFYEHPSISAVLARHLADNYVKPDDSHGHKLKTLETQIKSLEAAQKSLQAKYDALRVDQAKEKQKNWKGKPEAGAG